MSQGIIILRSNEVDPDPRVEKTAKWLSDLYSVTILAWNRGLKSMANEQLEYSTIHRQRNYADYGNGVNNIFSLTKFNCWLLLQLFKRRKDYHIIHACDLDTVLPALLISRLFRKKLVYDIFDYFSASRGLKGLPGKLVSRLENFCIRKSDALIIVDHTRYVQIPHRLPENNTVVYNVPDLDHSERSPLIMEHVIAYVGVLQNHRFIEELCGIISGMPQWKLNIAGFGPLEDFVAKQAVAHSNINFFGRVSYTEGLELSRNAKVLVAIYDPVLPNHQFASPNKLFEGLALGKILIGANNSSVDQKIIETQSGYTFDYKNKDEFIRILHKIEDLSIYDIEKFSQTAYLASKSQYSPLVQKNTLLKLYAKL